MARDLDGTDDSIIVSSAIVTAYPFTMACWFNTDINTSFEVLMSITDSGSDNNFWLLTAAGDVAGDPVRFVARTTTAAIAATTTGFTVGTWHHAAAVGTSATSRAVFIDGGSKGTNTTNRTPAGMNTTGIGVRETVTDIFFDGKIAEAAIWNVALTDDEVLSLSRGVNPTRIRSNALLFYVPLLGTESPEPDIVGGTTGTVVGAVISEHPPRAMPPLWMFDSWQGAFTAAVAAEGWAHLLSSTRNRLIYVNE